MPNEYGISKHPAFILHKKFWKDLFATKSIKSRTRKARSFYENYGSTREDLQNSSNAIEESDMNVERNNKGKSVVVYDN